MKTKHLLYVTLLFFVALFMVECEDDSGENIKKEHIDTSHLVPDHINKRLLIDDNFKNDVTHELKFYYNHWGNPMKVTMHTVIPAKVNKLGERLPNSTKYEKIHTINVSYDESGRPKHRDENIDIRQNNNNIRSWYISFTYDYSNPNEIIGRNEKQEVVEIIRLNSNNKVSEYEAYAYCIANAEPVHFKETYSYNALGNIQRYTREIPGKSIEYEYTYDRKSNTYKNINAPQWFIATLLAKNGIVNNPYDLQGKENNKAVGWVSYSYEYNSNGFPIEVNRIPSMMWMGTYTSFQTIDYMEY